MKTLIAAATAGAFLIASGAAMAGSVSGSMHTGAKADTPGIQMQNKGSVRGTTGAPGYSSGHQMQTNGSANGSVGASGYAPGRASGHVKTNSDINAGAKVK
ncbi:MAG: hypothetical protein OJF62_000881 [Pseudolabrys sp.]|jgi:hypothetical protein|nr:hypothetical protein [Pseudolabrys sp.]